MRCIRLADLSRSFTGVVLELAPAPASRKRREREPIDLLNLIRLTPDTIKALAQGFLLSVLPELFVVLSPFYMQLVVDEAILKGDRDLLTGLVAAFALLQLFNAAAGVFRSFVFQFLGNTLSFATEARLFHHMIRLPLGYFQKRATGDLLQRFRALEPVKQLIVGGGVSTVLDGSLAVFTGILMVAYSARLSAIVFGVFAFYALLRLATRQVARRLLADAIVAEAREQTRFLETLRAIQTIKANSGEAALRGMLGALPITRVIVAHGAAMAEIADRVLVMTAGRLAVVPHVRPDAAGRAGTGYAAETSM